MVQIPEEEFFGASTHKVAGSLEDGVQILPFRNRKIVKCQGCIQSLVIVWSIRPSASLLLQRLHMCQNLGAYIKLGVKLQCFTTGLLKLRQQS
eukprot:1144180-Pelagomonas_calceolata.AAC.3